MKKRTNRQIAPRAKSKANSNDISNVDDLAEDSTSEVATEDKGDIASYFGEEVLQPIKPMKPMKPDKQIPVIRRKVRHVDLDAVEAKDRKLKGIKAERGKLTKEGQKQLKTWTGINKGKARDAFFSGLAASAQNKFNSSSVLVGTAVDEMVIGIPMPSLALEFLTLQSVFPLSIVTTIQGKWRTCKSALLYEIFRWFSVCNGGAILNEAEGKLSPDLCRSIMQYEEDEKPLIINKCHVLEDWQRHMTHSFSSMKQQLIGTAANPGPGRTIPVCIAVDSVTGRAAQEKKDKIVTEGSSDRAYPVEALKIAGYLRAMISELEGWPLSVVLIRHLNQNINAEQGDCPDRTPGGDFIGFQQTFALQNSVWRSKIAVGNKKGIGIRIECTKNSLGETGRKIRTRMLWWNVPYIKPDGTPGIRQQTQWDWHWSTTMMLHDLTDIEKRAVKEAGVDFDFKSPMADAGCLARSAALGMGKDEWLTFSDFGHLLSRNDDVMQTLRNALGVKERPLLQGDYLQQMNSGA